MINEHCALKKTEVEEIHNSRPERRLVLQTRTTSMTFCANQKTFHPGLVSLC